VKTDAVVEWVFVRDGFGDCDDFVRDDSRDRFPMRKIIFQ
jgi:hypothetical protein